MIGTSLKDQLTQNIGAGEEIRFFMHPLGLEIHRIHGDLHERKIITKLEIDTLRDCDGYLGETLLRMAVDLRGYRGGTK